MASWMCNPLCLILAPIHSGAVSAPANKYSDTMTKGEHDDEKLLNYTSAFWWDIFQTSFSPNKVILSSLLYCCFFVCLFWFGFGFFCLFHLIWSFAVCFRHTFHHRSVHLLLPLCFFTSLHLSFIENEARVSATTCCVVREGVCMWSLYVCNYESEFVGGWVLAGGLVLEVIGWAKL